MSTLRLYVYGGGWVFFPVQSMCTEVLQSDGVDEVGDMVDHEGHLDGHAAHAHPQAAPLTGRRASDAAQPMARSGH